MSKTVDERVVSMQFDNAQFERNVSTSMSTLDKLKQSLNLSGASKGLENVSAAAKNVNFSPMASGLETVRAKFSALEVMGVTALANITNSAVNAGKRIAAALTIDPLKSGFQEYETQIGAVQTILANTKSKGSTLEDVNSALDELNKYADQTIYNFTEMTKNIGTFTAAGVDLDKSVTSIKGIANLAAVSGSTSQQASTAMYQLSQALAAGKVSLMDWNSVVNAGMGGELFQEALKRTSRNLGTGVDEAIEKYGTFRESLTQGEWLTTEVLTETLTQLSGAYTEADLIAQGYTEKQAKEIVDLANTAVGAATEVKTFSGVIDTVKESLQSGWAQTWEIIFGDFEEAKSLFTEISDVLGGLIIKSAESRNEVLQGWKDLGGRTALIDSLRNAFEGISSIIKPIKEAFNEIFPPATSEQLYNLTTGLRDLTEKLKISDETAAKLKSTFKGVFSVIDIFIEAIKAVGKGAFTLIGNLTGLGSGILDITSNLGYGISGFRDYIKETNLFGTAIEKVTGFLSKGIDKIKEFANSIKESIKSSDFEGFVNFFSGLWNIIKAIGSGIANAMSSIGGGIADAFGGTDFFDVLNNGLFAGILLYVGKFIKGLSSAFDDVGGILENVTGILDDVRGCFEAYQNNLKAGTLLKIASAIGILAASLFVISTIDSEALTKALVSISVLFLELMGSLLLFSKMDLNFTGTAKTISTMIGMSLSILILSSALKKLSTLDWEGVAKGLAAVGGLMAEIALFLVAAKFGGKIGTTSAGIVLLSTALLILSQAVENFGSMDWSTIGKGLTSIGVLLAEIAVFSKLTKNAKGVVSTGAALVLISASMKTFASAMSDFGSMDWSGIGKGLVAMGGALAEVAIATRLMPKNTLGVGIGLVAVGAALEIIADSMSNFGNFSWDQIAKGLVAMGGSLAELSIALNLMRGTLAGSAALLVASGALAILAPVLKSLGDMSWESIGKGLVTLAGAFTIIGLAGLLLSPLIPTLLGLAGAFAVFGLSVIGIGAGLTLIGTGLTIIAAGFTALATAGVAGATAVVAALSVIITGIASLIPIVAQKIGEGVVAFAQVIGEYAPQLADAFLKLISEVMKSLANYVPQIADSLFELLIGIINSLSTHMPALIEAVVNLIGSILKGVIDALKNIDPDSLLKGIVAIGLLSGLMYALSGVAGLTGPAMLGVLGVGAVVAELGVVLAAIGGLAQIPGLKWLIGEGGEFLQLVGNAIGKFIGGIVGGFAEGVSSSFPQIGSDLSGFMTNLQPFIEGAQKIDPSMLDGVNSLVKTILLLTAADVLEGLASWITGGSSLTSFAEQLVPFGHAMKNYASSISGIDAEAVTASAMAANALAVLADNLPNSGGLVSWFTGENDLSYFAEQLAPFGEGMKKYSDAISGIDAEAVTASANAAKSLSELAANLPNSGGIVSWFTGENDLGSFGQTLVPFAKGMKEYSDAITGIDTAAVESSAVAAKSLSELAANLPNSGGIVSWFAGDNDLGSFGDMLVPFGKGMKDYSDAISGMDAAAVEASAVAAKALSELANNLPNSGGLVSFFTGDNSLDMFGLQLVPFGRYMKDYSDSISGIDPEVIESSTSAAKALAELANNLPNSGGIVSWFAGDNDIGDFGSKLVPFGEGMKEYADSISGIDAESVEASAVAAKALSELATNLPKDGGVVSWFTGDNNIGDFGNKLVPFGEGMKEYSDAVVGIDSASIEASANAAKSLSELATNLPNSGGAMSWFTGDNTLSDFGNNLVPFGEGIKEYSDSVIGVDISAVSSSADAARTLVDLVNNLSNSGGVISWFTGDNTLSDFGNKLIPFGEGMKKYAESVTDLDTSSIRSSVYAAEALADLAGSLSSEGGLVSLFTGSGGDLAGFGRQLVPFGKSIKQYSEAVVDLDISAISNSANAAKKLVAVVNTVSESSTNNVSSFVKAINELGTANVEKFVKAFSTSTSRLKTVGAEMIESVIKGIKSKQASLISASSGVVTLVMKTVNSKSSILNRTGTFLSEGLIKGIKSKESAFVSAANGLIGKFVSGIISQRPRIISALTSSLSSAVNSARGYYNDFYSAGSYLVTGFANSISSNTYAATARARAMASAAASAARSALSIHSPSKVFYKIGDYAGLGFVNALGDYVKTSYDAGSEIATYARNGLSNAIGKISDLIDGGIDTQPTIRPVLDLSDVERGANGIAGMFDTKIGMSAYSNINAVSTMMNRNRQNGSMDDVVSAINKLRRDLGNVGGTSYNINGITYDDGSAVSEAIKTLVNASIRERRV